MSMVLGTESHGLCGIRPRVALHYQRATRWSGGSGRHRQKDGAAPPRASVCDRESQSQEPGATNGLEIHMPCAR